MSTGLTRMTEDAESLLDQGRIVPALELLKEVRSLTRIPSRRLWMTFNIGVLYWDKLGDGLSARTEFLAAADMHGPELEETNARVLSANALENLMLSALSFEEFDAFTSRLMELAPEMPVVSGLPPTVHEIRDHAGPWSSVMIQLAMSNYDRNDSAQDRARYGVAKSTYHLLLANRKYLRLSRADWRLVVFEYAALALRMSGDCMNRRGESSPYPPEEFLPMLTDTVPFVDEYLSVFTGDDAIQKVRDEIQSILDGTLGHWTSASNARPDRESAPSAPDASTPYRCRRCGEPVPNLDDACPSCGKQSPLTPVVQLIFVAAVAAGLASWYFSASDPVWMRVLYALCGVCSVFFLVGPIVYQLVLAGLKKHNK